MDKQKLYQSVEKSKDILTELSDKIWSFAELSMKEFKSAEYYCQVMEEQGFTVERQLCGIPTAFSGKYGTGKPVIGILGEFDALDGLSQEAGIAERKPLAGNTCGHGCGHNMLGAASLGAAMAIKEAITAGDLQGTVIFYGCPGEEGCAGKTFMARDGMFRDLDAAITWHPGDVNEIMTGSNAASLQFEYSFTGVAAHAAGDPQNGRSALDAAELMNMGVQFLREHMDKKESVHYAFLNVGGVSPNVVQPTAIVLYMIRGETVRKAKALKKRVDDVAQGAALMTGTTVTFRQIDGTASTISNQVLEKLLHDNMLAAPLPEYTLEEWELAGKVRETYHTEELPGTGIRENADLKSFMCKKTQGGKRALNDFVVPYYPMFTYSPGSTDVGDVSWLTPTAQFTAVTWASGSPGHSWQNVSLGHSSIGYKGLLYAAKALAGSCADLMEDPELLKKARAEFEISAAEGYDCPIGPEVVPGE